MEYTVSATNRGGDRKKLDTYYTPLELSRFLVKETLRGSSRNSTILEPSSGSGSFVYALEENRFPLITTCDVDSNAKSFSDYTHHQCDFMDMPYSEYDWIIGNPPYSEAEAHTVRSLYMAKVGVGFLLRLGFLGSKKRHPFWQSHKPYKIMVLSERPSFSGGGTDASEYAWYIWLKNYHGPTTLEVVSWK